MKKYLLIFIFILAFALCARADMMIIQKFTAEAGKTYLVGPETVEAGNDGDDLADTDPVEDWTDNCANIHEISTDVSHAGTRSCSVKSTETWYDTCYTTFTEQNNTTFTLEFWLYIDMAGFSAANRPLVMVVTDGTSLEYSTNVVFEMSFTYNDANSSDIIVYDSSAAQDTGQDIADETWTKIEVEMIDAATGGTFNVWVGGNAASGNPYDYQSDSQALTPDTVQLLSYDQSDPNAEWYIDDLEIYEGERQT